MPFSFSLQIGSEVLEFSGSLPEGACAVVELMPLVLSVGQGILDALERQGLGGRKISCGPGCGACCRQLVPVSRTEGDYLRQVVIPGLDPDHRQRVLDRVEEARSKIGEAGLRDELDALPVEKDAEKRQAAGLRYFWLGLACPFLEDESCSIHAMRPLACREYLVTSPARCCSEPSEGGVEMFRFPLKPSHALIRRNAGTSGGPGWETMMSALIDTAERELEIVEDPVEFLKGFLSGIGGSGA